MSSDPVMTRRALVVRGGWEGHHPVEATESFLPFLERSGFDLRIEDSPAIYGDAAALAETDLIVQCVTMAQASHDQIAGLRGAVAAGTGLIGWHGGIVDSYRESAEYLQLVGGQFAAHPSRGMVAEGAPVDNEVRHTIAMTELGKRHPLTTGLNEFELVTEQYWVLHDDLNDVLATTTQPAQPGQPWHRPVTSPAVWTRQWGSGRIVVVTPGHDVAVLNHPTVRAIVERGMLWASRTE